MAVAAGNIETALKMAETRPSSGLDWEPLGAWATKNNDLAVLKRIVNGIQDDNFIRHLIDDLLKAGVPDTAVALTDIAPVRNELKMELLVLIANHLTNLKQCPQALPLVQRVLQNCKRGEKCGRNRIEAAENFRRCGQSDHG